MLGSEELETQAIEAAALNLSDQQEAHFPSQE